VKILFRGVMSMCYSRRQKHKLACLTSLRTMAAPSQSVPYLISVQPISAAVTHTTTVVNASLIPSPLEGYCGSASIDGRIDDQWRLL
jgi:hypothetical protein